VIVADADSNHRRKKNCTDVIYYLLRKLHKIRAEKHKHLVQILEAVTIQLQNNTDKTEQNAQIKESMIITTITLTYNDTITRQSPSFSVPELRESPHRQTVP